MIASICLILLLSAFFSGLEIAFVSSNKMLLEMEREHRSLTTRILDRFYRRQNDFITTLLVGNNIALVIYGILMAHLIRSNPLVNTLVATVIVLFIGEFLPKMLFRINPNRAMHFCAVPALFFYFILWPVSRFTSLLAKLLLRCFGLKMKNVQKKNFTKTDLDHLIQSNIDAQSDEEDVEDEVIMFQNALDFGEVRVRDCVVPRTEIVAAPLTASFTQVLNLFIDNDQVEDVKIRVGTCFKRPKVETIQINGRNVLTGLEKTASITSEEIREALEDSTSRIADAVHGVLEKTSPELAADITTRGIVLTGGGALLDGLTELLEERTGINTMVAENPSECVAVGTGLYCELMDRLGRIDF